MSEKSKVKVLNQLKPVPTQHKIKDMQKKTPQTKQINHKAPPNTKGK